MNMFVVALLVGGLGLVAMALLGMGSGSHAGGGHGHAGHAGHAGGHAGHLNAGARAGQAGQAGHGAQAKVAAGAASSPIFQLLATLASPRVILSVIFGFGLTGLLASRFVSEGIALAIALVGGVLFEALFVAPLWRFLFRFASKPATTLDHALFSAAHAVTNFDKDGHGLVKIEVDGQVVQLLATLRVEDRSTGARVHTGDELLVEEIDEVRQRCRVSTR